MLKLAIGTLGIFFFLFLMVLVLKKSKSRKTDFMSDLRSFDPGELERLKAKGLLSSEEAKKVQLVIAERAVKWSEQISVQRESPPVDINTLLSEAEDYRRNFEKSKADKVGTNPEEDPIE